MRLTNSKNNLIDDKYLKFNASDYCEEIISEYGRYFIVAYSRKNCNDICRAYDKKENKYVTKSLFLLYSDSYNKLHLEPDWRFYQAGLEFIFGPGEYLVVGEYKDMDTPVKTRHKCGSVRLIKPEDLLNGYKCSNCTKKISSGERIISDYLNRKQFRYIPQYKDKRCKDKLPLPFDFAIMDQNNQLDCIIEYDGQQHFEAVEYFGGEDKFLYNLRHDIIKNSFCENNNIPILRIPYIINKKEEIEAAVSNFISTKDLTKSLSKEALNLYKI